MRHPGVDARIYRSVDFPLKEPRRMPQDATAGGVLMARCSPSLFFLCITGSRNCVDNFLRPTLF